MPKTRLGIDIGTASLGWCFYSLRDDKDKGGKPVTEIDGVIDAGVRIFSDSRSREQGKQYLPLNVFRRESRLASRGRDRYLQRRDALMRYLVRYGLMPEDRTARKRLEKLNPYELRAWAISDNESPMPQFESQHLVGRAIFHLNQRRGFKSNRRTDKTQSGDESEKKKTDKEAGAMKSAVEKFDQEIKAAGCKTAGEFLWKKHGGRSVRARPKGSQNRIEFYEGYYATRALIEAEFDAIWKKQAEIHPQIFTDERGRVLREIIFRQRPLAPAVVGRCTFCPEYRARKGLPSYQRFRILQEVNNLRLRGGGKIPKEAREEISDRLLKWRELQDDDGLLHFDEMKKIVEAHGVAVTSVFTVASRRRAGLFGDKTSHILREIVGEQWDKWTAKTQDDLVHLILDPSTEDEKTTATIIKDYGLDSEQAKKCVDADTRLQKEHGEVCLRDIGELLPHLEKGLIYNEAVKAAGLGSHSDQRTEFDGSMPKLPPYQKVLPQYCNPLRKRDEGDKKAYRISNPTVHVGLNQLRLVVNDIIRIHGKPTEIVVELAREFGMGKIGKEDYGFLQGRLQAENTRRRKEIEDLGFSANEGNLLKMRLWEELNSNPCHRCCVYTGKRISITNLFSPDVEIEHILPFSKTGDNSTANKTLCYRQENRIKSDRTPFEEFGENSNYEEIVNRAKQFVSDPALEAIYYRRERRKVIQAGRDIKKIPPYKNRKYKRFEANAKEKFLGEHDDFTERYLNETQFLSRAAKQYLEAICPRNNILVIHGGLTALIRRGMGLDSILSDDEATQKKRAEINDALACEIISEEEAKRRKGDLYRGKNRNDHRHHAVDAAVIGATSRSLLQELSTEAKKMEDINSKRFAKTVKEAIKKRGIDLRDEIAAKIDGVIISHKPQRGRDGQLHKKFAYRILHDEDKGEGVYTREVVRSGEDFENQRRPHQRSQGKILQGLRKRQQLGLRNLPDKRWQLER